MTLGQWWANFYLDSRAIAQNLCFSITSFVINRVIDFISFYFETPDVWMLDSAYSTITLPAYRPSPRGTNLLKTEKVINTTNEIWYTRHSALLGLIFIYIFVFCVHRHESECRRLTISNTSSPSSSVRCLLPEHLLSGINNKVCFAHYVHMSNSRLRSFFRNQIIVISIHLTKLFSFLLNSGAAHEFDSRTRSSLLCHLITN